MAKEYNNYGQNIKNQARAGVENFLRKVGPGSDRDIKNWDQRLKDQLALGWDNYMKRRLNLDTARDLELWPNTGEFLYIENVSSKSAKATVRLNRNNNDPIDLELGTQIKTIFIQLHITHTAQPGEWIDIITGINFEYYKESQDSILSAEAQPCLILTKPAPGNVVAPAHPCNRVLIRAHTGNAGTVWIDFATAAVVNACYELTAGDAISSPCSNTNRINGNFTAGGDNITIVYEV